MKPRVLIIGGGFGGVAVAQELDGLAGRGAIELHLVSRENAFLFHPMLPEAAGGGIEVDHILSPIRQLCRHATVTVGQVQEVDLELRRAKVIHGPHNAETSLDFDHLVLAVGAVTNFSELTGMAQHAFGLKTVGDALYLRNHIINMLEEADGESDPDARREYLTFVVAGGGFSGVEMVAELNDFVHEAARFYRRLQPSEIRVVLLHAGSRILPELSEDLARFALKHLQRRGVETRLDTMLAGATECEAVLKGGECLASRTLVCTIGTAPNPLLGRLGVPLDERGRVVVTPTLEVSEWPGVWALGDCAAIPNAATGQLAPPTAQFAQREARVVANNIRARLFQGEQKGFSFSGLGQFVSLGRRSAVAEVFRFHIAGFLAWFLWRSVYLSKLPSWSRRTRVALDWTIDLFFGRDIAHLPLARGERVGRAHYEAGDIIIHQGETGDLFFVIADGEVEIVRAGTDGNEQAITRLGPGEFFGELALMRQAARNATVKAVTAVNVLTIGRDDFTVLSRNWASLRETLVEAAGRRQFG